VRVLKLRKLWPKVGPSAIELDGSSSATFVHDDEVPFLFGTGTSRAARSLYEEMQDSGTLASMTIWDGDS